MQVVNAIERRALAAAREEMWMAAARAAGAALLVAIAVVVAMGVGASPWWALVGFAVSVLLDGLRDAWTSVRCERDIRRCSTCRAASIGLAEAGRVWDRCSSAGHPDPRAAGAR